MHWCAWQDLKAVQKTLRRLPKLRPHKGKLSEWFNINSGFRQGCVAAPDLFNCVVDHLMSRVCAQIPAVSFGNLHLADLEYADDTILLSNGNDIEKLTAALSVYDRESRKLGLKVSWAKTKLMHVGEGPDPPSLNIDIGMLWNLRIHLCIWVRQSPTTVTLNSKSSADAHYHRMCCRHFAIHCGASSPFRVPPRCAYTMQQSCLCCCTRGDLASHWNPLLQA